jgi:hypothetical protein
MNTAMMIVRRCASDRKPVQAAVLRSVSRSDAELQAAYRLAQSLQVEIKGFMPYSEYRDLLAKIDRR